MVSIIVDLKKRGSYMGTFLDGVRMSGWLRPLRWTCSSLFSDLPKRLKVDI